MIVDGSDEHRDNLAEFSEESIKHRELSRVEVACAHSLGTFEAAHLAGGPETVAARQRCSRCHGNASCMLLSLSSGGFGLSIGSLQNVPSG